jgi:hypothetical protein
MFNFFYLSKYFSSYFVEMPIIYIDDNDLQKGDYNK